MSMRIVPDHITNLFERLTDSPMLWIVLGLAASAAAINVMLIVLQKERMRVKRL